VIAAMAAVRRTKPARRLLAYLAALASITVVSVSSWDADP
jgi:hypothetical protein